MKRLKQFLLVATLGVFLGVFVFGGTASAEPVPSFTVTPEKAVVGETVTVTSTTSNPEGLPLTYEWAQAGYPYYEVRAGSPQCLNADCSKAQWTYATPRLYEISLLVKWPGSPEGKASASKTITIITAGEAPAPIYLVSPTTVKTPTVLEVLSPKEHLKYGGCQQVNPAGSELENCQPYAIRQSGPDAGGFFHYRFRLAIAQPGTIELAFTAWNKDRGAADLQYFRLNVTGNSYRYGDVRTCYWHYLRDAEGNQETTPGRRPIENIYDLRFFSELKTQVTIRSEIRRQGRWLAKPKKQRTFLVTGGYSPWKPHEMRIKYDPPSRDRRLTYEIKHGRRLLKRGTFSRQACAPTPGLIGFSHK